MRKLFLLSLSALILTGCASNRHAPTLSQLDGDWQQTGRNAELKLNFQEGRIAAKPGCNNLIGSVTIEQGRLVGSQMAGTRMLCPPEQMKKDEDFTQFIQSNPKVKLRGDTLVLQGTQRSLKFRRVLSGQ